MTHRPVHLPHITIPVFDGTPTNYNNFIQLFRSLIDNNQALSNIDKFNYLSGLLIGDAKETIRHFLLSEENYKLALETLAERFGSTIAIVSSLIRELHTSQPNQNSLASIKSYVLKIEQIRLQLIQLKKPVVDEEISFILSTKLPKWLQNRLVERSRMNPEWTLDSTIEYVLLVRSHN
ncbi:unnamed protein product [Bursaphelenchus okinawaensis]|uniref:Uncharacterized protein n=1 Tax=Bursaphelenchus okinawaensis TaxID=465554 RepID=A0A811LJQ6_9BILA|nr:unnamed protein product [Bursaphelenchus okinawaensis]CAG9127271.1 unnamed protein product [Bursaphelenchus okinawaensis]